MNGSKMNSRRVVDRCYGDDYSSWCSAIDKKFVVLNLFLKRNEEESWTLCVFAA